MPLIMSVSKCSSNPYPLYSKTVVSYSEKFDAKLGVVVYESYRLKEGGR